MLLKALPLTGLFKFNILLVESTGLLLASYGWGVRYTVIGKGLNGVRMRPSH